MKTSQLFKILMLPALSIAFLYGCGGSKNDDVIPSGRSNFSIGDPQMIQPINGSSNVCKFVRFQFDLSEEYCSSNRENIRDIIKILPSTAESEFEAVDLTLPRFDESNGVCSVFFRASGGMSYDTDYDVIVKKSATENAATLNATFSFKTISARDSEDNCPSLMTQDGDEWRRSSVIDIGKVDENGDFQFDGDDWRALINEIGGQILGGTIFGFTSGDSAPVIFKSNLPINGFALSSNVSVYKFTGFDDWRDLYDDIQAGSEINWPGITQRQNQLGSDCETGSCVILRSGDRQLFIMAPGSDSNGEGGEWDPGIYLAAIPQERLESVSGIPIDYSYIFAFTVNQ